MAARREITKKFAREYVKADKAGKGEVLDALVAATGWTRDHARRTIRTALQRKGAAREHAPTRVATGRATIRKVSRSDSKARSWLTS